MRSKNTPNACTERGSTHREAEANTVQESFIEGVQLCPPHYAETQSYSEVSEVEVKRMEEGCCKAGEAAVGQPWRRATEDGMIQYLRKTQRRGVGRKNSLQGCQRKPEAEEER